jgi:type II secretory pathway predicted ATPase ExeA
MATSLQISTPFSLTPDPGLLYETPAIETVMFKTRYVVEQRQGLTCILGDVGLGKSTVLRALHSRIAASEQFATAFLPSPSYPSDFALLKAICAEFRLQPRRSMLAQENELKGFLIGLYEQNKTAVVFIDEAQRLKGKEMELIRTLNNFETDKVKLIQIVLAAQLELQNKLRDPSKKAIKSRIFFPSLLSAMSLPEAAAMLAFRCEKSYIQNPFPADTVKAIYDASQGVPREILKIAAAAYAMMQMRGATSVPAGAIAQLSVEASIE